MEEDSESVEEVPVHQVNDFSVFMKMIDLRMGQWEVTEEGSGKEKCKTVCWKEFNTSKGWYSFDSNSYISKLFRNITGNPPPPKLRSANTEKAVKKIHFHSPEL